jgi:hypothetical protein
VFFHHIRDAPGTMKASGTLQFSLYYCVFFIIFEALQAPWRLLEYCDSHYIIW